MTKKQTKTEKPLFERDEMGFGGITAFESFILPDEELAPGTIYNGHEIYVLRLTDDLQNANIAVKWVEGDSIKAWKPSAPEGDAWVLSAIIDGEDSPFAVFARPANKELTGKDYAQEFLLGALINAATKHLKTLSVPWIEMKEAEQKRTLAYVHDDCRKAVIDACDIISSNARTTFPAAVEQVVFKDGVKVVLTMAKTPEAHSIADAEGSYVTIVIEERSKLLDAGNSLEAMPDQKPLFDQSTSSETMPEAA